MAEEAVFQGKNALAVCGKMGVRAIAAGENPLFLEVEQHGFLPAVHQEIAAIKGKTGEFQGFDGEMDVFFQFSFHIVLLRDVGIVELNEELVCRAEDPADEPPPGLHRGQQHAVRRKQVEGIPQGIGWQLAAHMRKG